MITLSDLNKAAQARKSAKQAIAQVAQATINGAQKVMTVAESAMQAVSAAFPASNKALDERTQQLLVLHAGMEQRVENIEGSIGVQTVIDVAKAAERAGDLFSQLKARKEKKEVEAPAAEPIKVVETTKRAPRGKIQFNDVPRTEV
jgi:Na+/phosphate symporter